MTLLDCKVAIVTGAGAGIGREHDLQLAGAGARVVVNDVSGSDAVVGEIAFRGGGGVPSHDSVATLEGAQRIVWAAMNRFNRVDILVNNAGILRDRTLMNLSE